MIGNRKAPYPFDCLLAGKRYMLGAQEKGGELIVQKPQDLGQVSPDTYDYSSQNPQIERVTPYNALFRGFGLGRQTGFSDDSYSWAENMDLSCAPLWLKGPAISTLSPTVRAPIVGFMEVAGGLWAVGGRYAHKRTSDGDWDTGAKDFGVGKVAIDSAAFYSNGLSKAYGYVAMGDAEPIWRWSQDIGWEQHNEASKIYASAFRKAGLRLYRANSINQLALVDTDADPFVFANWSAENQHRVGEKSSSITRLAITASGVLIIFKTDGIYTLDTSGNDVPLFPYLGEAAYVKNGWAWAGFLNDLYVAYGDGLYQLSAAYELDRVGLSMIASNTSPIRGRFTALCADGENCLYGAVYNPDTGDSYLLKWGSHVPINDAASQRINAWHGSITPAFAGKQITTMHKSTIGAPTGHARMYLGFDDGTIGWFTLPCSPNPLACEVYEFSTAVGYVHLPTWTAGFPTESKLLRGVTVHSRQADAANFCRVQYKPTTAGEIYTDMPRAHDQIPKQRVLFPSSTVATEAEFLIRITGNPVLTGLGIHHRVQSDLLKLFTINVLAVDGIAAKDGTSLRRGAVAIGNEIERLAGKGGSFVATMPDGRIVEVSIVDYAESQAWSDRWQRWVRSVALTLAESASIVPGGQLRHLRAFTLAQLEGYTIEQMEGI